ncbi:cell division protein SepF [Streptococcus thermophilus]|uniref:cell division protein SepF n=1 Tax=Streptococcus thermophilus TaxID=1308 RepID=UPI0021823E5A|nr:cell division protein SepF [Streptococcus thermophilus]MCS8612708.1 cell division protein SepF [Streptococcus thermophilus]
MAIKDAIEKIVSYFDADEVTDHEDVAKERPVKVQKTEQTPPQQQRKPERPQETVPPRRQHIKSDVQETQVLRSLPLGRSQVNQGSQQMNTTKTTIAIKYPKKYEDAQEIVELLIENECVLIDFQYMLEAQARRCLDFIDGASKVLTGNLQKVGSSMYLLTPINVVVDIEEIGLSHGNQESTFDFDMKRR